MIILIRILEKMLVGELRVNKNINDLKKQFLTIFK